MDVPSILGGEAALGFVGGEGYVDAAILPRGRRCVVWVRGVCGAEHGRAHAHRLQAAGSAAGPR